MHVALTSLPLCAALSFFSLSRKVMADEEKTTLAYDYAETVLPTVFAGAAEQVCTSITHCCLSLHAALLLNYHRCSGLIVDPQTRSASSNLVPCKP